MRELDRARKEDQAKQIALTQSVLYIALGGIPIPQDVLNEFLKNIPEKRLGKPEEIAKAVIFLLKNDYITGQVIVVDGGLVT